MPLPMRCVPAPCEARNAERPHDHGRPRPGPLRLARDCDYVLQRPQDPYSRGNGTPRGIALIGDRVVLGPGQRGGPTMTLPNFSAASAIRSGEIWKPSGRGVDLSQPEKRNMPSIPPGVLTISRSALAEVIR